MSRFDDGVAALLMGQPFYATLLMKMKHVADDTLDPPSACVTPKEIRYHPTFFESLTTDEAIFVLAHEVTHMAWQHLSRVHYYNSTGVGPDGQPFDAKLFNAAMDYPINASLVDNRLGTDPNGELGPTLRKIGICLDMKRFPASMTPEEVYCELAKDAKQSGGSGKGSGAGTPKHGAPLDGHEPGDPTDSAVTPADVIQAANAHKAIRGEFPAGFERLMGELRKPAESPWRVLRSFITKSLPGHDATSWRKLQRRYVVRGIGIPGRVMQGSGRVGIVVDTSGSIGEEMLSLFGGHMAAIMSDARPQDVVVYWVDAKVHRRDVIRTSTELRALLAKPVPGGGGTDMPKGVRAAEGDNCDAIVVLTDGYTPFTSSPRKLLWAITNHNIDADSGRTIHI